MSAEPAIVSRPADVEARLNQLHPSLTSDVISEAVRLGRVAWAGCTENDPPSYAGFSRFAVTTRTLRDRLLPRNWIKSNARNYCTVISPDRAFRIVVVSGDENTGKDAGAQPKSKHIVGPVTINGVEENQAQLSLFDAPLSIGVVEPEAESTPITWMLLLYTGVEGGRVVFRAELSLPEGIGGDGRVEEWRVRLLLAAMNDDEGFALPVPEPGPDVDVPVIRRAS